MKGSCNCGAVTFAASGDAKAILNCHCNLCRKMNGSVFSTYVVVAEDSFSIGSGSLKTVQVSDNASKSFCSTCGTPIYNQNPKHDGFIIIHYGALDDASHLIPLIDTFYERKIPWVENLNEIKKLEKGLR